MRCFVLNTLQHSNYLGRGYALLPAAGNANPEWYIKIFQEL